MKKKNMLCCWIQILITKENLFIFYLFLFDATHFDSKVHIDELCLAWITLIEKRAKLRNCLLLV